MEFRGFNPPPAILCFRGWAELKGRTDPRSSASSMHPVPRRLLQGVVEAAERLQHVQLLRLDLQNLLGDPWNGFDHKF